jgi:hypothetical protein
MEDIQFDIEQEYVHSNLLNERSSGLTGLVKNGDSRRVTAKLSTYYLASLVSYFSLHCP